MKILKGYTNYKYFNNNNVNKLKSLIKHNIINVRTNFKQRSSSNIASYKYKFHNLLESFCLRKVLISIFTLKFLYV